MNRRRFLSSVAPLAAIAASGCGYRPFTFIQMADPQIGMMQSPDGAPPFTPETAILTRVVDDINRMRPRPAFVTVCGDLTSGMGNAEQTAAYLSLMGRLDPSIPCHNVSGNHDVADTLEGLARFREVYGPDHYYFVFNGWWFVVLNSTILRFPGGRGTSDECTAQKAWLQKTLADAAADKAGGIVVFMHHPFFQEPYEIDEIIAYDDNDTDGERWFLDLFADHGVNAVYSGHLHLSIPERSFRGVRLINTNAICNSFDGNPGLRIVRVYRDRLEDSFHRYDALPESVTV